MSRRGNCHDNAVAASFFATFKKRVTRKKIYSTRDEAKTEIFNFIEMFYNLISAIRIQAGYHLLNSRERIFWNNRLSSESGEVHRLFLRMIRI